LNINETYTAATIVNNELNANVEALLKELLQPSVEQHIYTVPVPLVNVLDGHVVELAHEN